MLERDYPGRLTREEWRAVPRGKRHDLAKRAQCDLLGSFRHCRNKMCLRARCCSAADPSACVQRLWKRRKSVPKTIRNVYSRLETMIDR